MQIPDFVVEETFVVLYWTDSDPQRPEFYDGGDRTDDIECAEDYADHKPKQQLQAFLEAVEEQGCKATDLRFMRIEKGFRFTGEAALDEHSLLEARHSRALAKLNPDDIAALGVTNLAVYDKVQTHNVEEQASDSGVEFTDLRI